MGILEVGLLLLCDSDFEGLDSGRTKRRARDRYLHEKKEEGWNQLMGARLPHQNVRVKITVRLSFPTISLPCLPATPPLRKKGKKKRALRKLTFRLGTLPCMMTTGITW